MMLSEDIREMNRLERNAKRLQKVLDILETVQRENNVSDLDIGFIEMKVKKAKTAIMEMRKVLVK